MVEVRIVVILRDILPVRYRESSRMLTMLYILTGVVFTRSTYVKIHTYICKKSTSCTLKIYLFYNM